jgi:hypothetical protein
MKKSRFFRRGKNSQSVLAVETAPAVAKPDYENLFLRKADTTTRCAKATYIRTEFHKRIMRIVQTIGGNEYTLFDYLDSVLAKHFDEYRDEISDLYRSRSTDVF